jgi:Asp-tRNA(Asn)/Glu-tRNA(Gln) amidotransferase A subunit family amidase
MLTIWVEAAAVFDDLSRSDDLDLLKEHDNSRWPEIFRAARTVSAVDYVKAQQLRTQLVSDFCAAVSDVDAIVCPGTGDSSMTASNFTGHPSLTIPVGFVNGMPRAMTIVGHHWDEQTILEIGDAYQRATDWHCRRPPLDES